MGFPSCNVIFKVRIFRISGEPAACLHLLQLFRPKIFQVANQGLINQQDNQDARKLKFEELPTPARLAHFVLIVSV